MGLAIMALTDKRDKLITERDFALARFNAEISEIEAAIEHLSGKKVWEVEPTVVYDDENPDYIKGSIED